MGERGLFPGHVRFADSVDLYVGHEDDLIMRNWPHALSFGSSSPKSKSIYTHRDHPELGATGCW